MTGSASAAPIASRLMKKAVRVIGWGIVAPLSLIWLFVVGELMVSRLHMNDFGKFYYSTALFLEGRDMYLPSPATEIPVSLTESRQFLNMNPPHFHLATLPLAALDPLAALLLWAVAGVAALIVSLRLIASELSHRWTAERLAWTCTAVLACSATSATVVTGQLTFLLMLPVTAAWIAARRGSWTKAAVYLGVCASVKPFLGVFLLYFVIRRHVKAAAIMTLSGLGCGAIGLAVFGWKAYESWVSALSAVDWAWAPMNGALAGLVARLIAESPSYTPVIDAPWMIGGVTGILALTLTASAFWMLWRDRSPDAADRAFAGLLVTAQLVSPLGWIYYTWLLAGPAAALYASAASRPSPLRDRLALLAIPGLLVPVQATALWGSSLVGGLTIGSIYVWTTLCMWGSVVADGRAAGAATAARQPSQRPAETSRPPSPGRPWRRATA